MLTDAQKSNIAQWVSEFPRYSHVITDPSMVCIFAKNPPPADPVEVDPEIWEALANDLKM